MTLDIQRDELSAALYGVARGDSAALKEVYDRTSAKLFGICVRILGERSDAEDVLQEAYLSIWRNAAAFDATRASPITWLATIARNRAIDRVRARRSVGSDSLDVALEVADPSPSALYQLETSESVRRLDGCVGELESRCRDAIKAAFLDGHTYETLSARAGVPLGTMKSWIRRSLIKLKACMDQ